MKLKSLFSGVALTLTLGMANAAISNFSFSGNFAHDNDVQQFAFSVGASSSVSLRSWSYAGGTNADGTLIARGGFDPILGLFNATTGVRLFEQDDAGCPTVAADAVTTSCFDTFFTTTLAAGNYIATIQQYNNFSAGANLSNGFFKDGIANQNFRNGFVDFNNNTRDSHWAFDILNVNSATLVNNNVPEPESLALVGAGLLGLLAVRRRKQK